MYLPVFNLKSKIYNSKSFSRWRRFRPVAQEAAKYNDAAGNDQQEGPYGNKANAPVPNQVPARPESAT